MQIGGTTMYQLVIDVKAFKATLGITWQAKHDISGTQNKQLTA
jgi:ribosome-associated toxin RatA of RatAB toxin-antitoxin module